MWTEYIFHGNSITFNYRWNEKIRKKYIHNIKQTIENMYACTYGVQVWTYSSVKYAQKNEEEKCT